MKKLLIFPLIVAALVACKDEDGGPSNDPYPTDGLVLEPETKSLLIFTYAKGQASSAGLEALRKQYMYSNKNSLNSISLVSGSGGEMYTPISDSLYDNYDNPPPGVFILNDLPVEDFIQADEDIKTQKSKKPVMAVSHKVTSNDTAWVVDVKIKVLKDTSSVLFYTETYMLADIPAKAYASGADLRMAASPGLIVNTDEQSFWDASIPSFDSSATLVTKGDAYSHNYILMANYSKKSVFGTNLNKINPFEYLFATNDVFGTRHTPIRHYFLKDAKKLPDFDFKPRFITVIWYRNYFINRYEYVNSYSDNKTY